VILSDRETERRVEGGLEPSIRILLGSKYVCSEKLREIETGRGSLRLFDLIESWLRNMSW